MISLSHFKILFQMLFLVRVTSTEYNWVTLAEGRQRGCPNLISEVLLGDLIGKTNVVARGESSARRIKR